VHVTFSTIVWLHSCFMYTTCGAVHVECIGYVLFQHLCERSGWLSKMAEILNEV